MSIRTSAVITLALSAMLALSACANTVRGAGQDITNTADAVGDTVTDIAN